MTTTDDDFDHESPCDDGEIYCPHCDGTGTTACAATVNGRKGMIEMDCPECGGTGWYSE